jgi:hypothetical protein
MADNISGRGLVHHLGRVTHAHRLARESAAMRVEAGVRSAREAQAGPPTVEGGEDGATPGEPTSGTGGDSLPQMQ